MTATLDGVTKKKAEPTAEQAAALELVRLAKDQGLSLTGPDAPASTAPALHPHCERPLLGPLSTPKPVWKQSWVGFL